MHISGEWWSITCEQDQISVRTFWNAIFLLKCCVHKRQPMHVGGVCVCFHYNIHKHMRIMVLFVQVQCAKIEICRKSRDAGRKIRQFLITWLLKVLLMLHFIGLVVLIVVVVDDVVISITLSSLLRCHDWTHG